MSNSKINNLKHKKNSTIMIYLLIALFSAACSSCYINDTIFNTKSDALYFLLKVVVFFGIFYGSHVLLKWLRTYYKKGSEIKLLFNKLTLSLNKNSILMMMATLLLAWLPYLIIFYPGVSNYDTANQINDFYNGTTPMPYMFVDGQEEISYFLNDAHPITTTFIMVPFVAIGKLSGYTNLGMFLYVIFQMIFTAFSFSVMIGFLDRLGCPYKARRVGLLFLALMPFIPMHTICMLKDCLYAAIFVLYTVYYVAMIKKISMGRHELLIFTILSLMTALTKKTGLYLVIICNVFLLMTYFMNKRNDHGENDNSRIGDSQKKIIGIASSIAVPVIIMWMVFPKILFPLMNIFPGGKGDVYGTLFQQTARVISKCGEVALSTDELETVGKLIDVDNIADLYTPLTTDPVKATFNMHANNKEISDYLSTWFRVGLRHPVLYIESTLSVCGGFFSPKKAIDIFDEIPITPNEEAFGELSNPSFLNGFRKSVSNAYYYICELSGIDILFQIFTYIWLIPVVVFASLKDKRSRLSMLPVGVSILILIVCPVCYARYAISQIYIVPLVLGLGMVQSNE